MRTFRTSSFYLASALFLLAPAFAQTTAPQLPDAPGKETVQRVCGACHSANTVLGREMTRTQWSEIVSNMVAKGAKGTPAEFSTVIDYLSANFPPQTSTDTPPPPKPEGGGGFAMGPDNKQVIDKAAADRGKALYGTACAGCHGPLARGARSGPDLVRSVTILHDRYGKIIGPFLRSQHPGQHFSALTGNQVSDLSHFLHQAVADTLRSGPYTKVLNVLTGDPKAGAAYFNGPGGCNTCHSPTGDLARIASRYDAPAIQQHFLFPRTVGMSGVAPAKPVSVTVTTPDGISTSGTLVRMDDFTVSLTDTAGDYHSWTRTPHLKLEKHDPYAAHDELLDQYTDKDIHNLVAYLETLK